MRTVLAVLLLVALVMVPGCVGSLPDGPSDDGGGANTTDGGSDGTPGGGPALAEVTFPDGVSDDEVNVSEMLAGHEVALADRSFTSHLTYSVQSADGDESLEMTARVAAGGLPRSATLDAADRKVSLYLTEETAYQRQTAAGGAHYEVRNRTPEMLSFVPVSPSGASFVEQFVGVVNFTPTDARVENGTTVVVLTGQGVVPTHRENVTEFDATMLVDERGVVREVSMTVQFTADSAGTMTFEHGISAIGETTVEEPDWIEEAEREASA